MSSFPVARRIVLGCVAALALSLVCGAATSSAAVFCVHRSACHGAKKGTVQAAIYAAGHNGRGRDLILVGRGRFRGPFANSRVNAFNLVGAGRRTVLTAGSPQSCAVDLQNRSNVSNLDVLGSLCLIGGTADRVRVTVSRSTGIAAGAYLSNGARFRRGTVRVPDGAADFPTTGIFGSEGPSTVEDSSIVAGVGIHAHAATAHSIEGDAAVTVRRVRISARFVGARAVRSIADSLIAIRGAGTGLTGAGPSGVLDATNLTVVGDGSPGSVGVSSVTSSSGCPGVCSEPSYSRLNLRNSIVRNVAVSLKEQRAGSCPDDCGSSPRANFLVASYSDYDPSRVQDDRPLSVDAGHNVNEDPGFLDPAHGDFRLRFDSPAIDQADVRAPGQLDLNRQPRTVDGNHDGTRTPDRGAYEYQGTGPLPVFTVVPSNPRVGTPIRFSASRTTDPDGGPLTYSWAFSDGTSATGRNVTHAYDHAGRFRVYLDVTNRAGQEKIVSRRVLISRAIIVCGHRC